MIHTIDLVTRTSPFTKKICILENHSLYYTFQMQILSNSEVLKLYVLQYQGPILIFHHLPLVDQSCTRHFSKNIHNFHYPTTFKKKINRNSFFQILMLQSWTKKCNSNSSIWNESQRFSQSNASYIKSQKQLWLTSYRVFHTYLMTSQMRNKDVLCERPCIIGLQYCFSNSWKRHSTTLLFFETLQGRQQLY